ncbi:uncharacterized protein LOC129741755 [Uranotaenia lowii]|uniref:uncharacterized protein LOC129741755 n=1 Tax=Uranotaenia lowii TaxID=190385 RepID=UPI0024796DA2|nr:uncharacterized protein LOC129741755 [Uranotaenia lowii]
MQALWKHQIDWDTPLPAAFQEEWREFQTQIGELSKLIVPRFALSLRKSTKIEIHGFCDASEAAYGSCLYLRSIAPDGSCTVRLLTAKSRVAPIDNKSIPRLELCGALLLAHQLENTTEIIDIKATIYLWTDSAVVLCWLSAPPSSWQAFVANRVAEIQELTPHATWNHVPSEDNPADLLSRGLDLVDLSNSSLWWNGPKWLATQSEPWPTKFKVKENAHQSAPEYNPRKAVALAATISPEEEEFTAQFSSLNQLIYVAAWGLRFAHNIRSLPNQGRSGPLTVDEKHSALLKIVGHIQSENFKIEIAALQNDKPLAFSSKLRYLKPKLIDGLIRVGGRLHYAPIAIDAKHPLILPKKHPFTDLIARSEHLRTLHGGPQLLLATIRQRFWPLGGRDLVRRIVHTCVTCTRAKPHTIVQQMGNLPADRITSSFVFENVGVDFAGPMYIRSGIRRVTATKAYVAVFVCLATKAVQLELVMSLTTPAFVAALERFIANHGKPSNIYCDNAKNFRGACNQLAQLKKLFLSEQHKDAVRNFCRKDDIQFHFIPPRSPSFGGLWEACVKSMKFHLRRIVGNAKLDCEEFITALAKVQASLNSRPITPLSTDPSDLQALTPGHFVIGRPINSLPEPDRTDIPPSKLAKWQRVQQISQHFWKRWQCEYLTTLQQTYRWTTATKNLAVGSMVIIKEENLPPLKWQLARVVAVHPGDDGLVRVATVETANGRFTRSIHKLCLLPIEVDKDHLPPVRHSSTAAGAEENDETEQGEDVSSTAGNTKQ